MVVRAERGNSYKSDIAIDDVSFSDDCYDNSSKASLKIFLFHLNEIDIENALKKSRQPSVQALSCSFLHHLLAFP